MQGESPEKFQEVSSQPPVERRHREACPRCERRNLKRMPREGIGQRWIFSLLGYYPWHCNRCGGNFLLKNRGRIKQSVSSESATVASEDAVSDTASLEFE